MPDKPAPKVFISYSHDGTEHAARVLELADALSADGIDVILDQYDPNPKIDWPHWMESNLDASDFVLMICTEAYHRRVMHQEAPGGGLGVQWEGSLIYNRLYRNGAQGDRFIPILFDASDVAYIPTRVQGFTYYHLAAFDLQNSQYEALYRHLTGQPATPKPEPGSLKTLPARSRANTSAKITEPISTPQLASPHPLGADGARLGNMPYTRNPFFTGRDDTLARLTTALGKGNSVAITQSAAISGMGGIGKTQTAVEYAYRYQDQYSYFVWMRAETETTLRESFVEVARLLKLSEADEPDQTLAVKAVGNWLSTNTDWLLILDNADDLPMAHKFLPITSNGHILYTTRSATTGKHARSVRIEKLSAEDGALLLLRRAKLIDEDAHLDAATSADRDAALKIAKAVDGLPLALDQAGAFIEEQQTSVLRYFELYEKQEARFLADYGNTEDREHASVAVTFSLAFAQAEAANPAVGDLIRFCAFLAPADIPELIFTQGNTNELGNHLSPIVSDDIAWEKLVGEACRYSLLSRDSNKAMISIHRLIQVVVHNSMTKEAQSAWVERAVQVVVSVLPNAEFKAWSLYDQLLPHAQVCMLLIKSFEIETVNSNLLFSRIGIYLCARAQYASAEPLLVNALKICKKLLGSDHSDTAENLDNLAGIYYFQGRYVEVEPLLIEALEIRKRQLGSDHPDTAESLGNLAVFYAAQKRYVEAKPLLIEALEIFKHQLDSDHPDTASSLNGLACIYYSQDRYLEAEPLLIEALKIRKLQLGFDHPDTAQSLGNLAVLYDAQDRYVEAEPLYLEALEIRKLQLGSDHPDTAENLNSLASIYYFQSRYLEAEPLYLEALEIRKRQLGSDHPDTASSLNGLANLYYSQGRYLEAEPLYLEALEIRKRQLGFDHPDTAQSLGNLAVLYDAQDRYVEAEPLYLEALEIRKRQLGFDHPNTASSLNNLANLYKGQSRYLEAEPLYLEALEIRKRQLGSDHPDTASSLNGLANLYKGQGRYVEAKPLYLEALEIRKRQLGSDHPDTASSLNNLAVLYYSQGRYVEAKPLYEQAIDISKNVLGSEHPTTITHQSNYDRLLKAMRQDKNQAD